MISGLSAKQRAVIEQKLRDRGVDTSKLDYTEWPAKLDELERRTIRTATPLNLGETKRAAVLVVDVAAPVAAPAAKRKRSSAPTTKSRAKR